MSTAPAWHPDPTGRFDLRYWSGTEWTSHVSRGGVAGEDPVHTPPVVLDPRTIEHLAVRLGVRTTHDKTFSAEYDESSLSSTLRQVMVASVPTQVEMHRVQLTRLAGLCAGEPVSWLHVEGTWHRPGHQARQ